MDGRQRQRERRLGHDVEVVVRRSETIVDDVTSRLPVGVAVDPFDTDLVGALNLAAPGVALTDWTLYPYVIY